MASTTLLIRIKKKGAVKLLDEAPVPEWQKKEVRKRLKDLQKNPAKAICWNDGMKRVKQLAK